MNIQPKTLNLAGRVRVSEVGTEVGEVVEPQEIEEVELSRHSPTVPGQASFHDARSHCMSADAQAASTSLGAMREEVQDAQNCVLC